MPLKNTFSQTFVMELALGPTQTAKHVRFEIEPRTLSRINKSIFRCVH